MTDSRVFAPNEIENGSCNENYCFVADIGLEGYTQPPDLIAKMVRHHGLALQICTDLIFHLAIFCLMCITGFFVPMFVLKRILDNVDTCISTSTGHAC
jgi:hypothetical protein